MRALKSNKDFAWCVVSVFLFCLFHLSFLSGAFASESDLAVLNGASGLNSGQVVTFPQGASNLTSSSSVELSFVEGTDSFSSAASLSKPAEFTLLGICVAAGIVGAVIEGGMYLAGSHMGYYEFDWYELSAACIIGAATAIMTVLSWAVTSSIIASVLGSAATTSGGLSSVIRPWIAGILRSAVSGITEVTANFANLKSAIESFDSELEDSMRNHIQALVDASSGQYQVPDFDSRWVDFSSAIPESYGMSYSGVDAEYNSVPGISWRLISPGSSQMTLSFSFVNTPSSASLLLTHLSSASESCPGGGYSPVDIYINGHLLEDNYDVAENHCGSHGFKTDWWDLSEHLSTQNTVTIELEDDPWACTHYWIQNVTILPGTQTIESMPFYIVSPLAGQNGSIAPDDLQTIPECGEVVFTAIPSSGYMVDSWYLDGLLSRKGAVEFTIGEIQASHTVHVTFKLVDAASIEVIAPNGGETWFSGRSAYITWQWEGDVGDDVRIESYKGGILDSTIESATDNDGKYGWSIPHGQPEACDYQIRISSVSGSASDLSDGYFCITEPEVIDTVWVYTCSDLQAVSTGGLNPPDAYYLLMNDIDARDCGNFDPIGSSSGYLFRGTFDGQGYSIRRLEINRPTESNVGLFSVLDVAGVIKNLNITEFDGISGNDRVGCLVGDNLGKLINCHVEVGPSDNLTGGGDGGSMVGGIAGENATTGVIQNCSVYITGGVRAQGGSPSWIGGVAGLNVGKIEWSWTYGDGDIDVDIGGQHGSEVGGLVGEQTAGHISECYSTVRWIDAYIGVGGLVGLLSGGEIRDSYYSGSNVNAYSEAGGIAGETSGGSISKCYVTANINASDPSCEGALVGKHGSAVASSFWCCGSPSQATGCGGGSVINCRELCDSLVYSAPFIEAGWNFTDVWAINEGVDPPELRGADSILAPPNSVSASIDRNDGVLLSWNAVTYNLGGSSQDAVYSVFRSESPVLDKQATEIADWLSSLSYLDTATIPEVSYYYWTKAAATINGARESDFSNAASGQRVYPPLQAPTTVSASDGLPLSVLVEWNGVTNANYYRVYRSQTLDGTKTALGGWISELSYIDYPPYTDSVYYYWVVAAVDNTGGRESEYGGPDNGYCVHLPVDVTEDDIQLLPTVFSVSQNYPNPFNSQTIIKYDLPKASNVEITIYNIMGQRVTRLVNGKQPAGFHQVTWDGTNIQGMSVATGIYFYRIKAEGFTQSKKMVLLK